MSERNRPAGDATSGPEPRGGPFERERQFMEERFATLQPKDETIEDEEAVTRAAGIETDETELESELPVEESPLPADFRQNLARDYRERQRTKMEEQAPPDAEETTGAMPTGRERRGRRRRRGDAAEAEEEEAPPEAPQPPPGNNWIPIGPSIVRQGQISNNQGVSGRVAGLALASVGGSTRVYAAAANGGVWRSDDEGVTWYSTMEAWDLNPTTSASNTLACGAIALDPADPDRVYVGTGEGATVFVIGGSVLGSGAYFGVGPIRSDDGGVNWFSETSTPSLAGRSFYRLALDPGDPERVVGATTIGLYRREPAGGAFAWNRKLTGVFTSVVAARVGSTTTFYAAQWGGGVFSSTDGHTWASVGTGFPTTNVGRVGLAVQPTNPSVVYALIENTSTNLILGVWRLDTTVDTTWRQVSGHPADLFGPSSPGQGWYDLAIIIDPGNVNRIYLGGSTRPAAGVPASDPDRWSGSMYRSIVSSSGSGAGTTYSMANTAIGDTVHADIHALEFSPGNANKLWVGCDGGVFLTDNASGTAAFKARNTGLATLTMEFLGQHPTEDAVLFGGTQDNGTIRYTGEEAWLHSFPGDGGFAVVNWNDPYKVVVTYPGGVLRRSTDGGQRYTYTHVSVPVGSSDRQLFYAPMAGTPTNTAVPAQAERLAYGSNRVWISNVFGGSWVSIPNNTSTDFLGTTNAFRIKSLTFASYGKLYAGLMNGRVYRYDEGASGWGTPTRIDNLGGANALGLTGPITDIAVDPADATGNSIYITFGGSGDYRHVWRFNGTQWQQRSGPSAGAATSLLDVQANAIVVDPLNPTNLYLGADIGVWQSTDSGGTWQPFSEGLPDAAVFDLVLHNDRRLLRAATHGRSVYERTLTSGAKQGVELFIRDTQLDQGRFTTINFLPDPTQPGETVRHWRGPDIKLDTPDAMGEYQFPLSGTIDFFQFVDTLSDDVQNVATHATETITTRVYVQVHNRGVVPANNVRVMCLLANASAGLPSLPAGYAANVQSGTPISSPNWETIGIETLNDVRVGFPKIAAFSLTSDKLPPPANLAGNDHHCVLALVHHADDQFTAVTTVTDNLSLTERKSAHKNLKVVQFTGTLPDTGPVIIPIRLNNPYIEEELLTDLLINLANYRGRARLYIPPLDLDGRIKELIEGLFVEEDFSDFKRWAGNQIEMIRKNQQGKHPYHKLWSHQQIEGIDLAMKTGYMLTGGGKSRLAVHRIIMRPGSYHTVFLVLDRPRDGRIGEAFDVEVMQWDFKREMMLGGQDLRIELVPEPKLKVQLESLDRRERTGVQFRGVVARGQTRRWFTRGWPAKWHVTWMVVPAKPNRSGSKIKWEVQAERTSEEAMTYWITVTNSNPEDVEVEGRYAVLNL